MKTQPKTNERRYIKLCGESNEQRPGFPDEYFEDDDYVFLNNDEPCGDDDYEDDGHDDDEVARKAEKGAKTERILGEICFLSGIFAVGAVLTGAIVLIIRIALYPLVKKIANDLDW